MDGGRNAEELSSSVPPEGRRYAGPPVLHVRGECEFPTAGYSVELRRRESQGINPKDLLLNRMVQEPSGPVARVVTVVEARYREETDIEYDTVTIFPDSVSVPVQDVH